ncbi:MAG: cupin domain-containing protein [Gammaproteobacteria bacterium]
MDKQTPAAVIAAAVPVRNRPSVYPEPYASQMAGRLKRVLGEVFALQNFGVNLVTLAPGAVSSLRHCHTRQDEFIYVLSGHPTLHTDEGYTQLEPGMCAGFKAGSGNGHHLLNRTATEASYLEVGDRTPGDEGHYPDDDIMAIREGSGWVFTRKDGTAF